MASANTDGAEKISFKIGKYDIINKIGGGSFGIVYLAFDTKKLNRLTQKKIFLGLNENEN